MAKHVRTSANDLVIYADGLDCDWNGTGMTAKHIAAHNRIVRACNAHDDLVAALELTFASLTNPGKKGNPSHAELLTIIRAALDKAKGG